MVRHILVTDGKEVNKVNDISFNSTHETLCSYIKLSRAFHINAVMTSKEFGP